MPHPVGDAFFGTLGIEVLQGRAFGPQDQADAPPVVVLSRAAAERLFPGQDPLGGTVEVSASLTLEEGTGAVVVGVVADAAWLPACRATRLDPVDALSAE